MNFFTILTPGVAENIQMFLPTRVLGRRIVMDRNIIYIGAAIGALSFLGSLLQLSRGGENFFSLTIASFISTNFAMLATKDLQKCLKFVKVVLIEH